jgi:hypothetical protein
LSWAQGTRCSIAIIATVTASTVIIAIAVAFLKEFGLLLEA